jgi:hypothetical protein
MKATFRLKENMIKHLTLPDTYPERTHTEKNANNVLIHKPRDWTINASLKQQKNLLEDCREKFNDVVSYFEKKSSRFHKDCDRHYTGWKFVRAHRASCYQAFTFVEKRFNDQKMACFRILTDENMNTCTTNYSALIQSLKSFKKVAEWLDITLALYQKRDGYPYNRKCSSNSPQQLSTKITQVVDQVFNLANLDQEEINFELGKLSFGSSSLLILMRSLICDATASQNNLNPLRKTLSCTLFTVGMQQSSNKFGSLGQFPAHGVLGLSSTKFVVHDHFEKRNCIICTATYSNQDICTHYLLSLTTYIQANIISNFDCEKLLEANMNGCQDTYEMKDFTNQYYRSTTRNLNKQKIKPGGKIHVKFLLEDVNESIVETITGMWKVEARLRECNDCDENFSYT